MDDNIKKLISTSTESIGGAAGAIFGLFLAGPAGAIAGGAAAPVIESGLKEVLGDFATRALSKQETRRAGTAAIHAMNQIALRLTNGERPRQDSFFQGLNDDRSPFETIVDGVLTTCRFQWEERKVPWIANIIVNAAFTDHPPQAINRVLALAELMTWRQYYILALAARYREMGLTYDWMVNTVPTLSLRQEILRQEIQDLFTGSLRLLVTNTFDLSTMGGFCLDMMGLIHLPLGDVHAFFAAD